MSMGVICYDSIPRSLLRGGSFNKLRPKSSLLSAKGLSYSGPWCNSPTLLLNAN